MDQGYIYTAIDKRSRLQQAHFITTYVSVYSLLLLIKF